MEVKQNPIIVEDLHLLHVDVGQQKIDVVAFKKEQEPQLNVGHKLAHNLQDERLKLELVFSFQNLREEPLLFFQIDFHFHVEHLANFYELKEEKHPVFNGLLLATLLGIAFSTARGIILEKLSNAGIPNVILPIVSPQELLTKAKNTHP